MPSNTAKPRRRVIETFRNRLDQATSIADILPGPEAGWRGLQAATAVTLTIVGGLLLFTVLVLVVGVPLWVMLRRRASARQMPATPDG